MRSIATVFFVFLFSIFSPGPSLANNPADSVNSSISTSTTTLPADGATTATISVTVKDSQKNPLAGDHIKLTSTTDSGLVINGGAIGVNHHTAATDNYGKVNFTVSSRNISPGTVTFTLTDMSSLPPVVLGSVHITFTPSSLAPDISCGDSAPVGTPMLQSATSFSANQITLTWSEVPDPVSYYLVAYGTEPKQYVYGNPNVGGKGTTSYTVGGLANGTTYYFVVRAGNGCAPGSFSNELAATVGVIKPTYKPTPSPSQKNTPTPTHAPILNVPPLTADVSNSKILSSPFLIIFTLLVLCIGGIIYSKRKRW